MKPRASGIAIAGLSLLGWGPPARALTLDEALADAGKSSSAVESANLEASAAQSRANAASAYWQPSLTFSSDWDWTNTPARVFAQKLNRGSLAPRDFDPANLNSPPADANLSTSLGVAIPIDVFGAQKAFGRAAGAESEAEEARAKSALANLKLDVTRAFFGVAASEREVDAAQRAVEAARRLEQDIGARRREGAALETDVLGIRVRRREREVDLERAESQRALFESRLRMLIGWDSSRPLKIETPPTAESNDGSLEEWTARAERTNSELAARRQAARAKAEMASGQRRLQAPAVSILGSVEDDRSSFSGGHRSGSAEVVLSWKLWDPGRSQRLANARELSRAAEVSLKSARDALRLEVERSWQNARIARLEAETALASLSESEEVLRVTEERWKAGRATTAELLETESIASRSRLQQARADAAVAVAKAELARTAAPAGEAK